MVPFKNYSYLEYILMVCFVNNVVHSTPEDEYFECIRQLQFAFGGHNTSTGCFNYAVEHYVKGQDIPIQAKDNVISNSSNNVLRFDELMPSDQPDHPTPSEESTFGSYLQDSTFHYDNFQDSIPNFHSEPTIYTNDYEDSMTNNIQAYSTFDYNSFQDSIPNFHSEPTIYVDDFKDPMANNIQADERQNISNPPIQVYSFNDLISNIQADPPIRVNNFKDLMPDVQAEEHQNLLDPPIQDENIIDIMPIAQTNYANLYYAELEKMVYGYGASTRSAFCKKYCKKLIGLQFTDEYNSCIGALQKFGYTQKDAVSTALTVYRLSECVDNHFIYEYMKSIIKGYKIKSPSQRPGSFCTDIWKKKMTPNMPNYA